jgi:hypothetical protein
MERAANALGKVALVYDYEPGSNDTFCFSSSWTLVMDPATRDAHPELAASGRELRAMRPFRTWTDDFSNMYGILK